MIYLQSIGLFLSGIWQHLEYIVFFALVFLFFKDPIRRWNFFGFRPTAVVGLFDLRLGKVLLAKVNRTWSFSQGGIYTGNLKTEVKEILASELGLRERMFKLIWNEPLGSSRIRNKELLNRSRINTFSVMPLIGKGYLACYTKLCLENIQEQVELGEGVKEIVVVTIPEARKLIELKTGDEHNPCKVRMMQHMLDEIEKKILLEQQKNTAHMVAKLPLVTQEEQL